MVETLETVRLACASFCRRDATLLPADRAISFMLDNFDSDLAKRFKESLSRRMNGRRTEKSHLLQYLHKCNQDYTELNLDWLLDFRRMNKTTIISMVASLVRLPENITSESEVEIEVAEGVKSQLSLKEKLDRATNDKINAQIAVKTRTMKDITTVIKKELINLSQNFKF